MPPGQSLNGNTNPRTCCINPRGYPTHCSPDCQKYIPSRDVQDLGEKIKEFLLSKVVMAIPHDFRERHIFRFVSKRTREYMGLWQVIIARDKRTSTNTVTVNSDLNWTAAAITIAHELTHAMNNTVLRELNACNSEIPVSLNDDEEEAVCRVAEFVTYIHLRGESSYCKACIGTDLQIMIRYWDELEINVIDRATPYYNLLKFNKKVQAVCCVYYPVGNSQRMSLVEKIAKYKGRA